MRSCVVAFVLLGGCSSHTLGGDQSIDGGGGGDDTSVHADAASVDGAPAVAPCDVADWSVEHVDQWTDTEVLGQVWAQLRATPEGIVVEYPLDPNQFLPWHTARRSTAGAWTIAETPGMFTGFASAIGPSGTEYICTGQIFSLTSPEWTMACGPLGGAMTVLDSMAVLPSPAMVVDPMERVHVTYRTAENDDKNRYAMRTPDGTWTNVELGGIAAAANPLAVDREGCVHVARQNRIVGSLTPYAVEHGVRCAGDAAFTFERVAALTDAQLTPASLVIDSQDRVNVIYGNNSDNTLHHARRELGGAWTTELVEANVSAFSSGMSADGAGGLWFTYMPITGQFTTDKVAMYIAADGTRTRHDFGGSEYPGSMVSLVDASGRVHVMMDGDNKHLDYATMCPVAKPVIE